MAGRSTTHAHSTTPTPVRCVRVTIKNTLALPEKLWVKWSSLRPTTLAFGRESEDGSVQPMRMGCTISPPQKKADGWAVSAVFETITAARDLDGSRNRFDMVNSDFNLKSTPTITYRWDVQVLALVGRSRTSFTQVCIEGSRTTASRTTASRTTASRQHLFGPEAGRNLRIACDHLMELTVHNTPFRFFGVSSALSTTTVHPSVTVRMLRSPCTAFKACLGKGSRIELDSTVAHPFVHLTLKDTAVLRAVDPSKGYIHIARLLLHLEGYSACRDVLVTKRVCGTITQPSLMDIGRVQRAVQQVTCSDGRFCLVRVRSMAATAATRAPAPIISAVAPIISAVAPMPPRKRWMMQHRRSQLRRSQERTKQMMRERAAKKREHECTREEVCDKKGNASDAFETAPAVVVTTITTTTTTVVRVEGALPAEPCTTTTTATATATALCATSRPEHGLLHAFAKQCGGMSEEQARDHRGGRDQVSGARSPAVSEQLQVSFPVPQRSKPKPKPCASSRLLTHIARAAAGLVASSSPVSFLYAQGDAAGKNRRPLKRRRVVPRVLSRESE